jgi:hypothetical protein
MRSEHPHFDLSELLWGSLAVLGCIAMVVFEIVLLRLSTGKW